MKIIDLKCAEIGENLVLRVVTDKGIDGYGQTEINCKYLKPLVPYYRGLILGSDPTDVDAPCSASESRRVQALGQAGQHHRNGAVGHAGKNAGVPVYKLLGGKIRDEVLVYKTGYYIHPSMPHQNPQSAREWGENIVMISELEEGFTMAKLAFAYHSLWIEGQIKDYSYAPQDWGRMPPKGVMTERGMNYMIEYVDELKGIIGDRIGLPSIADRASCRRMP
jgi:L-alanine-DL-glutamate epimerase-like enolase superfamily enzyme